VRAGACGTCGGVLRGTAGP